MNKKEHAQLTDDIQASTQSPAIAKAWGILKTLSEDEETRLLAESREKGRRDIADRVEGAYREGKLEVARNALCEKIPAEVIARITGLSINEIEKIRTATAQQSKQE